MISLNEVSVIFDQKTLFNQVSIGFKPGRIYGIVGFNGAGKSTFFNLLSGMITPDAGTVTSYGEPLLKSDIAFLETTNYFYSNITGREYLNVFKQSNENFDLKVLQKFMKLPLDDLIETYSTGMRKKLALLAMLKQDKNIYLLDEPFNGLDMEINKILEIIVQLLKEKGKTLFVSSHILSPLLQFCDEICVLEQGKFSQFFLKKDFDKIEDYLFASFTQKAKNMIEGAV